MKISRPLVDTVLNTRPKIPNDHIDDPGNNCGNSISNIFKYILGHVIGSTECKAKKNCPHKDADIVCVHKEDTGLATRFRRRLLRTSTIPCGAAASVVAAVASVSFTGNAILANTAMTAASTVLNM